MYIGRFSRGIKKVRMTVEPAKIPPDPSPAMARPTINALELGAAAHTTDPTSKTTIAIMNTSLVEWKV